MKKIITFDFLEGKKSYLGAAALFILGGLLALNVITREQFEAIAAMVSAWTVASLRKAL